MHIFCLIFFLSAVSLWFFSNESDVLFGVFRPTCAVRYVSFVAIVGVSLTVALCFSGSGDVAAALNENISSPSLGCEDVFLILLPSLLVLTVLRFMSVNGPITYAMLGALTAFSVVRQEFSFNTGYLLSFLAAPVMALILSALFRTLFRLILSRVKVHMVILSRYMRHTVIICLAMTAVALGLNWGGFLVGMGYLISGDGPVVALASAVAGLSALSLLRGESWNGYSSVFADFSIYAVISTGSAVALTMLFFSFNGTASLLGLSPVPLSVSSLVMAAVGGVEISKRSRVVENEDYMKELIGLVAAPVLSFVAVYVVLYFIGVDADNQMMDFIVLAVVMTAILAMAFAGYVRSQNRQKKAVDRLVYVQQQQIYENSRALNDMELKVVLSENQALHNAVEQKKQEVMNVALSIVEQKEFLESLDSMVKRLAKTDDPKEKDRIIAELGSALKQRLSYDRDVDSQYFYAQAESLHEDFNAKLSENFPDLTQQERRLATLLRLGFSSKYIATLMNITVKSVEISRYRLRQKLGLSKGDNLVNFIKSI